MRAIASASVRVVCTRLSMMAFLRPGVQTPSSETAARLTMASTPSRAPWYSAPVEGSQGISSGPASLLRTSRMTRVPGGRQVVGKVRPDEAARAGDRDLEARAVGPLRVPPEVQPRALVAKAEEAREGLAGRTFTDGVGEPAGRQAVLDVVEQLAALVVDRHEPVHVLPRRERPVHLPVHELPARHGAAHLRHPVALHRSEPDVEGDAPVEHVAGLLQHAHLLPRRRQTPERSRPRVIGEDLVGGRRHDAAPLEDRHRTLLAW